MTLPLKYVYLKNLNFYTPSSAQTSQFALWIVMILLYFSLDVDNDSISEKHSGITKQITSYKLK